MLDRTGIGAPDGQPHRAMVWCTDEMAPFLAATWRGFAPAVVRMEAIDEARPDALERELADCAT